MRSPVITQLEKDILPLQGIRPQKGMPVDTGLGLIRQAFPGGTFPQGGVHELLHKSPQQLTASLGFTAALLSRLADGGAIAWVGASRSLFPPALVSFGLDPGQVLFIHPSRSKDLLWTVEEVLKCKALTAVVALLPRFDFMLSRRLQLAVEHSGVTGFILRDGHLQNPTASIARWRITAAESWTDSSLPGVGFPGWNVELLKVRGGQTGSWQVGWRHGAWQVKKEEGKQELDNHWRKTG